MAKAENLKRKNIKLIRDKMQIYGKMTKPELANNTGLSLMTVNTVVAKLCESGELIEQGHAPSGGGRPSALYEYNYDYMHIALVIAYQDGKKNQILYQVADLSGKIIQSFRRTVEEVNTESFCEVLDKLFEGDSKIAFLAFGLPGEAVDGVITVCDYESLIGDEFISFYECRYKIPVLVENDINAATYGYASYRSGSQAVVGLFFPKRYPPGVGLAINGIIHRGVNSYAGEVKYLMSEINWKKIDYENKDLLLSVISKIVLTYAVVIAPEQFVFFADFLAEKDLEEIRASVFEMTGQKYEPVFILSEALEEDYTKGLTSIGLEFINREVL